MWQYQNTDELYHHGVLGMKWGVRRYQNADGSLTKAGKRKRSKMSNDAFESLLIKKKKKNQRTNEDLRKVNNRDNLERTYKQNNSKIIKAVAIVGTTAGVLGSLTNISKNAPSLLSKGRKATNKAIITGSIIYNIKKTKL